MTTGYINQKIIAMGSPISGTMAEIYVSATLGRNTYQALVRQQENNIL
jgi:hypothetical protein